jgi:hypothetical protein
MSTRRTPSSISTRGRIVGISRPTTRRTASSADVPPRNRSMLRAVGLRSEISPVFAAASASSGDSQRTSVISRPSATASCAGGVSAAKKRVSKRSGCSSGVIQCAKYTSRSVASVSFSARTIAQNAAFDFWHAARCSPKRDSSMRTGRPSAS